MVSSADGGRFPVLLSAHPYGKDNLPARGGRGWRVSAQYRLLRVANSAESQASLGKFSDTIGAPPPEGLGSAGARPIGPYAGRVMASTSSAVSSCSRVSSPRST